MRFAVIAAALAAVVSLVVLVSSLGEPEAQPPAPPMAPAEVATACGTIVGRSVACGHRVRDLDERCIREIRAVAERGRTDAATLKKIYEGALAFGLEQQKDSATAQSCDTVRRTAEELVGGRLGG